MLITLHKPADDLVPEGDAFGAGSASCLNDSLLRLFGEYGEASIEWSTAAEDDDTVNGYYVVGRITFTPTEAGPEHGMAYAQFDELFKRLGAYGDYGVE